MFSMWLGKICLSLWYAAVASMYSNVYIIKSKINFNNKPNGDLQKDGEEKRNELYKWSMDMRGHSITYLLIWRIWKYEK